MSFPFDPDYVVSPGETLRDWMNENGYSEGVTARACHDMDMRRLQGLLSAEYPLTECDAIDLAIGTRISKEFWLALEHNFRAGLAAGKTWTPR